MGTTAIVTATERVSDDEGEGLVVTLDPHGAALDEAEHYAPAGDDAPPLPGDFAAVDAAPGRGNQRTTGYVDPKNKGQALPGEKRIYSRTPDGSVAGFVWFHGDGLVEIKGLAAGERYKIGVVEIDAQGNITTPGEITARAGGAGKVTLTKHIHPTGTGPSGTPTPGQ
jgi:hypothetical protein